MIDIRILLVDDEEFYLRLFSDILASRRYEVRTARSAEEALEILGRERFDILITDLLMSGMDGLQLTEQVNKAYPGMDVVVVTQRDDVRLAVKSMRMGVFEYLVKPVDRDELLLTLDRLLERRRLMEQQNKLLDESMQYLQAQTVYRRCLDILSTLDFENLVEMILRHMLQATGSQGGVLWLTSPEGRPDVDGAEQLNLTGYRGLVDLQDVPSAVHLGSREATPDFWSSQPFFAEPSSLPGMQDRSGRGREALFIPLLVDDRPVGLLALLDKLRADFTERDGNIARTMAEFSAIAIKNARRFQALERLGLRDQGSTAYNLTYFIDYAGKEIYKARRYNRAFSLVTVLIDRFDFLRQHFKPEICNQMSRKLAESISRVVRDSDILARVSDNEFYVLLPETDALGSRMFIRRCRETFAAEPFIGQMSRDYPINITLGTATFPIDGDDFDELLFFCRQRMDQARSSIFRRLGLESRDLWEISRVLVGRPEEHGWPLGQTSEQFRLAEDPASGNAHLVIDEETLAAIEATVGRQAVDDPQRRAILYSLGGTLAEALRPVEQVMGNSARARAYVLGKRLDDGHASAQASVTRVALDDDAVESSRILLVLAEHMAYAFVGQADGDGLIQGFHSSDVTLVENMIAKLQEHFNFQRQY